MRPKATKADLPSTHDVKVHIHNEFVRWLKELKADIMEAPGKISVTLDSWSEDKTRAAYLGTTAAWIEPLALFLNGADELFGPITTLRKKGQIVKHIEWATFKLVDEDWACVGNTRDILTDANNIQQVFSSDKHPTLWRALPALKQLLSTWEKKKDDPHYALYIEALEAGIAKILKYYLMLDTKSAFMAWGGEAEQDAERAAGKLDAKNWYDKAMQIVEDA
ncbi:hypothetical protein H0H87_007008, partial [Tephrocybe sp. NHM501043]